MKKITIYIVATILLCTAQILQAQEWTPVFNFNSPNGSIAVSNNGKIFTYQPYHFLNQTYYEAMLSLDNGGTWTQVHDDKFATAFFNSQEDLYAVHQGNNYPGTNFYYPQSIYLTTDDGSSWSTIDIVADNIGQVNASVFRMDNGGTLYTAFRDFSANTGGFKYSTDDGVSWTLIPTFISGPYDYHDIFSALLTSNGDFFITTYNQGIFKSTDAGENWTRVFESFVTLGFLNEHPTTGDLYAASLGVVLKSVDNGENWVELEPDPWMAMNIKEFEVTSDGTFWFANSGGVFKSEDCVHWEQIWTPNARYLTTSVLDMAISENYVYVSTTDSTVYRKTRGTTGVLNTENNISMSIYPNPTSDFVTIKLDNIESNKLKNELSITDINGRLVHNINLSVGSDNYQVDISSLRSGLYMVNLNVGNRNYKQKLLITK